MKNSIRQILSVMFIFIAFTATAQKQTEIIGKITDADGEDAIGATVLVKGTSIGSVADMNGNYKINVPDSKKSILVFSYIGSKKKQVSVNGQSIINVSLESSSVQLNEVVAVGYGSMKRKDLTGSVVSVNTAEMAKVPTSNVAQALAGRVSGVLVTQNDGTPGSGITIRVRGGISITGSNEPLYIIDGFPSEDGLDNIDPASIESMDVLKDASSTAIYGARGANGVVVVTTKSGTESKTTVNYDGYFGMKRLAKKLAILSPAEFVFMDYERRNLLDIKDLNSFTSNYGEFSDIATNYKNRPGVNWQDEAFGETAYSQNHRFSIDGGASKFRYNVSYSYNKDQGQMVESGQSKNTFRLKLDHQISSKFSATATASFTSSEVYGMGSSDGSTYFNPLSQILQYRPTMGIRGNDEELITQIVDPVLEDENGNVMQNPVVSAREENKKNQQRTIQLNGGFTYKFFKGLSFKNSTGLNYRMQRNEAFYGGESIIAKRSSINGFIKNTDNQTVQTSNTLTYEVKKGKQRFNVMAGQEYITTWTRFVEASAFQFPNDEMGLNDLSQGALPGIPRSYFSDDNKLLSFFARAYYNYKDKYMITATMRADGSSKFGPKNKWGFFPSASVAWRASEEKFIRNLDLFSDLKVRLGYGAAGNNRIDPYTSLALMDAVTYPIANATQNGVAPYQIQNPIVMWEANRSLNAGFDLGFIKQRIVISPEFYVNNSSKLLLRAVTPASSGYSSMIQNIGETQNIGFDLSISTTNIKNKNFEWTTNLNISHNKNKIKALTGESFFLRESGFGFSQNDYIVKVGDPIGEMYGYKVTGLYQAEDFSSYDTKTNKFILKDGIPSDNRKPAQPGYWKYEDIAGAFDENGNAIPDGEITDADRTVIGHATPLFYGGINNSFTYKRFDLSIFLNFSVGNDVLNATKMYNSRAGLTSKNSLTVANSTNRWVTVDVDGNRITNLADLATVNQGKTVAQYGNGTASDNYITSWGVEDASFLRINNITFGYTLPSKWMKQVGLTKCRLYATVNNLYTFTKYTGYDPEVSTRNSSGLTPGVDWGAYPRSTSLIFGINLSF